MDISNITSVGALPRLAKDPVASVTPGQDAARKVAPASTAVSSAEADAQSQQSQAQGATWNPLSLISSPSSRPSNAGWISTSMTPVAKSW